MPEPVGIPDGAACAEEGRQLFFERVGRYFSDEEAKPFPKPLPCSVCGVLIDRGFLKGELVQCQAQRAILSKRAPAIQHNAKKEKKPRKDGTIGKERGTVAFNDDRRGVLITPSSTSVVVNVMPMRDLPPEMEWSADGSDAVIGGLYERLLDPDLELPALFVMFQRRADEPFVLTRSRVDVVQCGGGAARTVNIPRVASVLRMAEDLGYDAFDKLVRLKGRIVQGNAKDEERDEYLDILGRVPREMAPVVPNPDEPVMEMVRAVIKNRRLSRAA